jgi:hypothetical protein
MLGYNYIGIHRESSFLMLFTDDEKIRGEGKKESLDVRKMSSLFI